MSKENKYWHSHLGIISIGAQGGGPNDNGIGNIKVDLYHLIKKHCKTQPCPEVEHLAIALRIGGQFQDFSPEAIHRIRRQKKDKSIGSDIDIPVAVWKNKSTNELKEYLAFRVREAIEAMLNRLKKDKEEVRDKIIFSELDKAIAEFRKNDYSNIT